MHILNKDLCAHWDLRHARGRPGGVGQVLSKARIRRSCRAQWEGRGNGRVKPGLDRGDNLQNCEHTETTDKGKCIHEQLQ